MHDHPDRWTGGDPVHLTKRLLRDVVNSSGLSREELATYYSRWILFQVREVRQLQRRHPLPFLPWGGPLVEIRSARQAFESGATARNDA